MPRVTLAHLETLRGNLRADQFLVLMDFFKKLGVSIDLTREPGFTIRVDQSFIEREAKNEELMSTVIHAHADSIEEPQGRRRTVAKPLRNEPKK